MYFISPHFQAVRKAQSFHLFSQQQEASPGHLKHPMGLQMQTMMWSLSSQALHQAQFSFPHGTQVTGHGVTLCQWMEQEHDCQQEQQKWWRSTLQCLAVPLAWGSNRLATWEHNFSQAASNKHPLWAHSGPWASRIDQTRTRNKCRRAGAKIHHEPPHFWSKQKASYHLVLANSTYLQAGPQRKTFHLHLQKKPLFGR